MTILPETRSRQQARCSASLPDQPANATSTLTSHQHSHSHIVCHTRSVTKATCTLTYVQYSGPVISDPEMTEANEALILVTLIHKRIDKEHIGTNPVYLEYLSKTSMSDELGSLHQQRQPVYITAAIHFDGTKDIHNVFLRLMNVRRAIESYHKLLREFEGSTLNYCGLCSTVRGSAALIFECIEKPVT